MTTKQRNLLVGGIVAFMAGIAVVNWTPKEGVERADLVDAGVTDDFVPRKVACMLLVDLADGGQRYVERSAVVAVSKALDGQGRRHVIWPRKAALQVRKHLADENANCRVVANLTWAQVANFEADAEEDAQGSCACVADPPGDCRYADGGFNLGRNEMQPGDWVGADCVRKVCGEIYGRRNWPAQCAE